MSGETDDRLDELDLLKLLQEAEDAGRPVRLTFDLGRDISKPCTFCAAPAAPHHRLADIGRYPTGRMITRPVCAECWPKAERLRVQLLAQEQQA